MKKVKVSVLILLFSLFVPRYIDAAASMHLSAADKKLLRKALNVEMHGGSATFYGSKSDQELHELIEKTSKASNDFDVISFFSAEYKNISHEKIRQLLKQVIERSEKIIKLHRAKKIKKKQAQVRQAIKHIKLIDWRALVKALNSIIYQNDTFYRSKSNEQLKKIVDISQKALSSDLLIKQLGVQFKRSNAEVKQLLNKSINHLRKTINRRQITLKKRDEENKPGMSNNVKNVKQEVGSKRTIKPSCEILLKASADGDLKGVRQFIKKKGGELNSTNSQGLTALALAAHKGYVYIVLALVLAGADLDKANASGHTPMMLALFAKHFDIVRHLISSGADVNIKDQNGWNILMQAALRGYAQVVDNVLPHEELDLDAQNNDGETALLIATRWNHVDIAKKIIRAGADVNKAQKTGLTPLHEVVINGNVDLARTLLDAGANINARDTYRGRTPLHWVIRITVGAPKKMLNQIPVAKSVELIKLLLSRGADPMIKDFQGKTALQWARKIRSKPLLDTLKKARDRIKKIAYNQSGFIARNLFNVSFA